MQRRKSAKVCSHFCVLCRTIFLLPIRFDTSGSHQTSTQEQFHFVKKRSTLSTDKQRPSVFHVGTTQVTIWSHIITPREEILSASPLLVLYHDLLTEGEMHFMKEKVQCWLEMGCWSRKTAYMIKWSCQMLILRWVVRWIQPLCRTWPTTPERCQFQRKSWIHMRTIFNNIHVFLPNQYCNI